MYDLFTQPTEGFYNTTHEKGKTLEVFHRKADRQDLKILYTFLTYKKMTPSECWNVYYRKTAVPLTSVRRSITNLTKAGKLVKTNEKKIGIYGRPEYIWELK